MAVVVWQAYPDNGAQAFGLETVQDWVSSAIAVPYIISGFVRLDEIAIKCGQVEVFNLTKNTSQVVEIVNGEYSCDLKNFPTGYSNGDCISVCMKHPRGDEKTIEVDTVNYPGGRTVDIDSYSTAYLKTQLPTNIDALLSEKHGAGSWKGGSGGGGGSPWYPQDKEEALRLLKDLRTKNDKQLKLLQQLQALVSELQQALLSRFSELSTIISQFPNTKPEVQQIQTHLSNLRTLLTSQPTPVTVDQILELSKKLDTISQMVARLLKDEDLDEFVTEVDE